MMGFSLITFGFPNKKAAIAGCLCTFENRINVGEQSYVSDQDVSKTELMSPTTHTLLFQIVRTLLFRAHDIIPSA